MKKLGILITLNDKEDITSKLSMISEINDHFNNVKVFIFNECSSKENNSIIYLFLNLIKKIEIDYFQSSSEFQGIEYFYKLKDFINTEYLFFYNDIKLENINRLLNSFFSQKNNSKELYLIFNSLEDEFINKLNNLFFNSIIYKKEFLLIQKINKKYFKYKKYLSLYLILKTSEYDIIKEEVINEYNVHNTREIYNELQLIYNLLNSKNEYYQNKEEIEYWIYNNLSEKIKSININEITKKIIIKIYNFFLKNIEQNKYVKENIKKYNEFKNKINRIKIIK